MQNYCLYDVFEEVGTEKLDKFCELAHDINLSAMEYIKYFIEGVTSGDPKSFVLRDVVEDFIGSYRVNYIVEEYNPDDMSLQVISSTCDITIHRDFKSYISSVFPIGFKLYENQRVNFYMFDSMGHLIDTFFIDRYNNYQFADFIN